MSAQYPIWIGEHREMYLAHRETYALRFALELNAQALTAWQYARAVSFLDEAADVLRENIDEYGLDSDLVCALAGVLNNRSQLRAAEGLDPSEVLLGASDAGAGSVAFVRDALASHPTFGAPEASLAVNRLKALLCESLALQSRVLCAVGDVVDAREALAQAKCLKHEVCAIPAESDSALPEFLVRLLRRQCKDAARYVDGGKPKFQRSFWYRPPRSAPSELVAVGQ